LYEQKAYNIQKNLGIPTFMSVIQCSIGMIQFEAGELENALKSIESAVFLSQQNSEKMIEGYS
jgi:hypothetical protein